MEADVWCVSDDMHQAYHICAAVLHAHFALQTGT